MKDSLYQKENILYMDKESQRDFISNMKDEDLEKLIAENQVNINNIEEKLKKLITAIQIIENKIKNKKPEEIAEVLKPDYGDLLKAFTGKQTPKITEDEKKFLQEKLSAKVEGLKIKIQESNSLDILIERVLQKKNKPKGGKESKKGKSKGGSRFKNTLITLLVLTGATYGISKTEAAQEAWATFNEEGFDALTEQLVNKMGQEEFSENTYYVGEDSLQNIVSDTTAQFSPDTTKVDEGEKSEIMGDDFTIKIIGDTVQDGDANRFYTPCVINLNKEERFDYRNRGDISNITNTDGAMMSPFKPFVSGSEYTSELSDDRDKSTVIVFNTKTGKVSMGLFEDFKDDESNLVSETWQAKKIVKINVGSNNGYLRNIYQKGLILVDTSGNYMDFPIGIGKGDSGNELGGYSGGKILISTPDNKHSWFVYGTANQLKAQLEEFKKIYKTDYVLRYDLDQKAYAQTYQTKNKTIYGWQLKALDNLNSAKAESGNVLYLKASDGLVASI